MLADSPWSRIDDHQDSVTTSHLRRGIRLSGMTLRDSPSALPGWPKAGDLYAWVKEGFGDSPFGMKWSARLNNSA
jgi:hypothetical protein